MKSEHKPTPAKAKGQIKRATKGMLTLKKPEAGTRVSSNDLPKRSLEDALSVAKAISDSFAGKNATWEDIAGALGISPNNPNKKYMLWSAAAYGIVVSDDGARYSVSETGRKILSPTYEGEDREGKVKAIAAPKILARFFSDYGGSKLPAGEIFKNVLEQKYGVPKVRVDEAVQLILSNARFAGLLDDPGDGTFALRSSNAAVGVGEESPAGRKSDYTETHGAASGQDLSKACFIITPIGDDTSPERRHADTMLRHLIGPVLKDAGVEVIRADTISKPGHITKQIVEHIAYCRICITDLSFGNQNAHYELGVRHAFKLPSIQIIRKGDKIPFDIQQGRTIIIDTSDPYTIMDRINSAKAELAEHVKALLSGTAEDSPITMYLPKLKVSMG